MDSRFAAHEAQLPLAYRFAPVKAPHSQLDEGGFIHMDLDIRMAAALPLKVSAVLGQHVDLGGGGGGNVRRNGSSRLHRRLHRDEPRRA